MGALRVKHVGVADGYLFKGVAHFCPACRVLHAFPLRRWNGDDEKPTLEPDADVSWRGYTRLIPPGRCHYALRGGVLSFHADCTHALAGRVVELPALPAYV